MMKHVAPPPPGLLGFGAERPFYLLLDGAAEGVMSALCNFDPPQEFTPLFLGTRYARALNAGPLLLRVQPESPVCQWFLHGGRYTYAGLMFSSGLRLSALEAALREYLSVLMPNGKHGLLRYYDPQIFADLFFADIPNPVRALALQCDFWAFNAYDAENINSWFISEVKSQKKLGDAGKPQALSPDALEFLADCHERRIIHKHMTTLRNNAAHKPVIIQPHEEIFENEYFITHALRSETAWRIDASEYAATYARLDEREELFNPATSQQLFEIDALFENSPAHAGEYVKILNDTSIPMRERLSKCAVLGAGGNHGS